LVDWDDLVWKIAGPEGGARYFRIGMAVLVVGLICLVAVVALPIYSITEGNVTISADYGEMADEPGLTPLVVPNEAVLKHANLVIAASVVTLLMGIVLVLEGRRVIALRRFMVWHSEVRATALYALTSLVLLLLLAGGASLWSFAHSMPQMTGEGVTIEYAVSSPAAATATILSGLMVLGLLFMVYYNTVLSVYRGGGSKRTRQMARLAMAVAVVALAGLFLLRFGNIMTVHYELEALADDFAFEVEMPFTQGRLDYWAGVDELGTSVKAMNTPLGILGWLLLMTCAMGLAGCIGVAATSRRVRISTSMAALAYIVGILAIVMPGIAVASADDAFQSLFEFIPADISAGSGLIMGFVAPLLAIVLAVLYSRVLGRGYIKMALTGPVPEPELAQPMVDEALAEQAAAMGEAEPPLDVEPVPGEAPPRRRPALAGLSKRPTVLLAVMVVAIVVIAGIGYGLLGGGDGGGGGRDGRTPVDIENLSGFALEMHETVDMMEGQTTTYDVLSEVAWGDLDTSVYFVSDVTVYVTWQDEDDVGVVINRMENQPDTFMAEVYDDMQLDDVSDEASNTHGNPGDVQVMWYTSDPWVMVGNENLVATGNQEVVTDIQIECAITLTNAGDFQGFVRTQADDGNRCDIYIMVSGTFHTIG
jgi:hypothetical protein